MTETPDPAYPSEAHEPQKAAYPVSRAPITVNSSPARWLAPLAVAISLIAAGLAAWALVKAPASHNASAVPGGDADPKATVCTAFQKVVTAVSLQTHTDVGQEPVQKLAVAGNARLALLGGGQYLLARIPDGAPKDLTKVVREFANNLEEIGMNYLAGAVDTDPAQATLQTESQAQNAKIVDMCQK